MRGYEINKFLCPPSSLHRNIINFKYYSFASFRLFNVEEIFVLTYGSYLLLNKHIVEWIFNLTIEFYFFSETLVIIMSHIHSFPIIFNLYCYLCPVVSPLSYMRKRNLRSKTYGPNLQSLECLCPDLIIGHGCRFLCGSGSISLGWDPIM